MTDWISTMEAHKQLADSVDACLDIFNDFTEAEVMHHPPSIRNAWAIGKASYEYIKRTPEAPK